MVIIVSYYLEKDFVLSALIITKAFRLNLCMVLKLEFYKILMDLRSFYFFCILSGLPQFILYG